ncbi:MAG: SgcJ/EcaC family oxidoreductase [Gemmatimonadales bacterium]
MRPVLLYTTIERSIVYSLKAASMVRFNSASLLGVSIALAGCTAAAKPAADTAATATASSVAAAPDMAADQQAIRDVNAAWFKAYNAHDASALAALYADDAVLYMPGQAMIRGRDAIKAAYKKDVDATAKASLLDNVGSGSEVGASGDLGWETNTFWITDKSGKKVDTGKYLTVFARKDGKWWIVRDIWNSDATAPTA